VLSAACTGGAPAVQPAAATRDVPSIELVETAPLDTTLDHADLAETHDVWERMIAGARRAIEIEQLYASAEHPSKTARGEARLEGVLTAIEKAVARGVSVRLLADASFAKIYPLTLERLEQAGVYVRRFDVTAALGGVQHAKLMVVDGAELYLGSANLDWRSLAHVQELGVRVRSSELARQLGDLFEIDWQIAGGARAEDVRRTRAFVPVRLRDPSGGETIAKLVASPRRWLTTEIDWELPSLVGLLDGAARSATVQVLTYDPVHDDGAAFVDLHEALRRAAARGVRVRLLLSHWATRAKSLPALQALARVRGIDIRIVTIPEHASGYIPYARVAHAKYLVVDGLRAWIGTSNWSGDYFHRSRNVGLLLDGGALPRRIEQLSTRLGTSPYAAPLDPDRTYPEPRIGAEQ
jgi:phosphatidylserine/phosphatidylglycerophosphate/cardiolipin synthase-like enzyme